MINDLIPQATAKIQKEEKLQSFDMRRLMQNLADMEDQKRKELAVALY